MRLTDEELRRLYQEQTTPTAQQRVACPSADELAAVAIGDAQEASRIHDHLITCAACAAEFRALLPLKNWAADAINNSEMPVPEIRMTNPSPVKLTDAPDTKKINAPLAWGQRFAQWFQHPALLYATAAVCLLAALTLGWWAYSLQRTNQRLLAQVQDEAALKAQAAATNQTLEETRRQLEEANRRAAQSATQVTDLQQQIVKLTPAADLSQPQLNVPIFDFEPRAANRSTASIKPIEVPASAQVFTCVLNVTGQLSFANYELEIFEQNGKSVWRGEGLSKSAQNTFTLVLPRALLPTGDYRFKLSGVQGKQKKLVEEYAVQLQYK